MVKGVLLCAKQESSRKHHPEMQVRYPVLGCVLCAVLACTVREDLSGYIERVSAPCS